MAPGLVVAADAAAGVVVAGTGCHHSRLGVVRLVEAGTAAGGLSRRAAAPGGGGEGSVRRLLVAALCAIDRGSEAMRFDSEVTGNSVVGGSVAAVGN
jgi:hypothetical protein